MALLLLAAVPAQLSCDTRAQVTSGEEHTVKAASPEPVAEPVPEPEEMVSVEQLMAPYFADSGAADAARSFSAGDWEAARDGFAAYIAATTDASPDHVARAKLLMAICDSRLRRWDSAADGFAEAADQLPALADFSLYHAARASLFAGAPERASALAERIASTSRRKMDAVLLIGTILRQSERWDDAAAHYARYLDEFPDGIRRAEARYWQAMALERLHRGVPDAVDLYRNITVTDPRSSWARRARKRMKTLLRRAPRKDARELRSLGALDYIERGHLHYRAKRHVKAAKEFEKALAARSTSPSDGCVASFYLADSWFRHRDRRRAAPLFDDTFAQCGEAGDVDLQVKAAYRGGRAFAILGNWSEAAHRFALAEKVAAAHDHSYADDARVFRAEALAMLGEHDDARFLLGDVGRLYPNGDLRPEAMWRLAWTAYLDGDFDDAIAWLDEQLESKPMGPDRRAHARAQYWIGRARARLGDTDAAVDAYTATMRDYPLSYYALMAGNRLREHDPAVLDRVLQELAPSDVPALGPDDLRFRPGLIASDPRSARLFELYRLGLDDRANAELMSRGMRRPRAGKRERAAEIEAMWVVALLHHRAGRHSRAVWITRWHAVDYKRSWPVGEFRAKWEIAYPPAYRDLVDETAATFGYPPALQMAIVREESGFDPDIESWANAVGLGQLMLPTARHFGKQLGIRVTRRSLRDPEKNLAISGKFIATLWDKWRANPAMIPPCYNAGEGAVAKWMALRGDWPLDEWIEAIPSDQTRGYSKRVLGAYFTYAYLADGNVPVVSNELQ